MKDVILVAALLAGGSLLPSAALAQTTTAPDAGTGSAAATDSGQDQEQGDIVVTAQRRSERLTNVPISVTALSSNDLLTSGVTATGDLGKVVPGLSMDRSGPFSQPTIRGIGSSVTGPGIGTSVATYIDGFYQPSTMSNDFDLADVDSVQVLKGPQGTLFGRNSTGGAILVTTMEPSFDPMMIGRISIGSYQDLRANAVVSTGITDNIAIYGSAFYRYDRGYTRDIYTGTYDSRARDTVLRGKILFKPSDALRFTFAYTHGDINDPWGVDQVAYHGVSAAAGYPGVVVPDNPFDVANTLPPQSRVKYNSYYLTGQLDLGGVTVKSYTGWRDENDYVQLDSDKTAYPYQYIDFKPYDNTFTQEVDVSSNGSGRLQWVAGVFYYNDRSGYADLGVTQGAPRFTFLDARLNSQAIAGFADLTYEIAPRLFLTGGVRYNHEKVTEEFDSILSGYVPETHDKDYNDLSPRAVVRYQLSPQTSIYASYNRGYKAGTFNPTGLSPTPVRPERVNAYEVGLKTHRAGTRFEIAGYYYDYGDLQFVSYVGPTAQLTNAAKARIFGVDTSLSQDIGRHFQLSLSGTYTNAKYLSFPGANHYHYLGDGVITNGPDDASGRPMVRTPRFTGRAEIDYHTALAGGTFGANAAFKYQTRVYFDPFGETVQPGYGTVDARLSWSDPSDHVTFSVYGRNLSNEYYYTVVTQQSESWPANYGAPRTFGAEIAMKF